MNKRGAFSYQAFGLHTLFLDETIVISTHLVIDPYYHTESLAYGVIDHWSGSRKAT